MLFKVGYHYYVDLNLVLLYLPDECNMDEYADADLPLDFSSEVTASTEHVMEGGSRYAHAASTAYLRLKPNIDQPPFPGWPDPVQRTFVAFTAKAKELLKGQDQQLCNSLLLAYQVETGLLMTPGRVHLELKVDQPYSVKGLRTDESRRQRAEDAAVMAGHRLRTNLLLEAKLAVANMQELLITSLEAFNAQQVRPLLTQIDLGLWPQEAFAKDVEGAYGQYQQVQIELAKMQTAADVLWKEYSLMYKSSVAKDLSDKNPNDSLLEQALIRNINRYTPLRYL
jgi:hypothetical protein